MEPSSWKIRLLGGFCLESPSGGEVKISSRKARALVSILALNDGIALTREILGGYLWPDKPKILQQQNLRQAVTQLRDSLGSDDLLEATRDTCRISADYHCDALECLTSGKDAGRAILLPEMPEPIFESYRSELASFAPIGDLEIPIRAAVSLLEWTLNKDASRGLDILYSCRELIPSMPLPFLMDSFRASLSAASSDHPHFTWGRSQYAIVLMWAGQIEDGLKVAREALGSLLPDKDASDWAAAAHTAACLLIFRGRFEKAQNLIDTAVEMAKTYGLQNAVNLFEHGRALCFGYGGDLEKAVAILESLPASGILCAHLAAYRALLGRTEPAREALQTAKGMASNDDFRLQCQIGIAEGYILLKEGKVKEAGAAFKEMAALCEGYGMQFGVIHCLEGLALLEKDQGETTRLLKQAFDLRERFRYPLLPGDRLRLVQILPMESA